MNTNSKPDIVTDDVVVSIDYTLTVDGQVVDSTEGDDPLEYLQGHQNIIPGLEQQMDGMKVGQSKQVTVQAVDAYGEIDPENIIDVPRSEFPAEIPLDPGTELEVKNSEGEVLTATIASVNNDSVKLDFNHPLAGKTLTFDVTVVDLRVPTEEELSHGHVHSGDMMEDEEFEDFEEFEEEELDEDDEDDLFEEDDEEEDVDELSYEDLDDTSNNGFSDDSSPKDRNKRP